jgi:hypothetical protein
VVQTCSPPEKIEEEFPRERIPDGIHSQDRLYDRRLVSVPLFHKNGSATGLRGTNPVALPFEIGHQPERTKAAQIAAASQWNACDISSTA